MPTLASDLDFKHVLGAHRGEVLAHADRIEGMRVLILADQALQFVGELAAALERGDQPRCSASLAASPLTAASAAGSSAM